LTEYGLDKNPPCARPVMMHGLAQKPDVVLTGSHRIAVE
jgi:hypothetical protein